MPVCLLICHHTGEQRQARGGCIANLQLVACHAPEPQADGQLLFSYTFQQQQQQHDGQGTSQPPPPGVDGLNLNSNDVTTLCGASIAPGDWLQLSVDGLQPNVARVDVTSVTGTCVTVACRKPLQPERYVQLAASELAAAGQLCGAMTDAEQAAAAASAAAGQQQRQQQQQELRQFCHSSRSNCSSSSQPTAAAVADLRWRLDHDEAASLGMHARANVLRVASDHSVNVTRLRRLIVDLQPPRQLSEAAAAAAIASQGWAAACKTTTSGGGGGGGSTAAAAAAAASSSGAAALATAPPPPTAAAAALPDCVAAIPAVRLALAAGRSYLATAGAKLNPDQVSVLQRILALPDYCLVLGMPGALLGLWVRVVDT